MWLRHRGAGLFFGIFVFMFAVFYGIGRAASADLTETGGILTVLGFAVIFAAAADIFLIFFLERGLGRERTQRILRMIDLIFLIAFGLPAVIITVWFWMHSIIFAG